MERVIAYAKSPSTFGSIFIIGLLTAVSGELKLTPFDELSLRVGFGSIIFFIAILMRQVPIVLTGIVTGIIVCLFRTVLDTMQLGMLHVTENLPAMFFYVVFASGLALCKVRRFKSHPFILGLMGAVLELVANGTELILHILLLDELLLNPMEYGILVLAAMIRSFFVVGIYSVFIMDEQKKRTEQLLSIHASLYVEAIYIEKIMQNIEEITSKSFVLHRTLQQKGDATNLQALDIAQSIHELKKDAQRINAGLAKIVQDKPTAHYEMVELLEFIIEANKQYALSQQKDISIETYYNESFNVQQYHVILALINNIVANAVEAIEAKGTISLIVQKRQTDVHISIRNSGPPIEPTMREVIFDAGFTTKFNEHGFVSTGIGLSHVKSIVEQLNGSIQVKSEEQTEFIVTIPLENL